MIGKKSEVPLGAGTGLSVQIDWEQTLGNFLGLGLCSSEGFGFHKCIHLSKLSDFTLYEIHNLGGPVLISEIFCEICQKIKWIYRHMDIEMTRYVTSR